MAQKEIITALKVKTGQSENTIKALKAEITQLKKSLENAEIGSEEFAKASRDLATAQANLKTVMADGKKAVDAADGSYNHLVATMAELKKAWRATADEAKRNEIGQQIDVINTKLKEMDASIGNHQRNVGNYKEDIIAAFDEMEQGTFNYGASLAEMNKSTEVSRGALDGVGKMASGVAGGFAALQGVMALCGKEGGNFEKVMVKMTAALSIAQGVGGLKGLIEGYGQLKTAFAAASMGCKGFIGSLSGVKKAIMATGIGVLVVAIGTLIAYWDDLVKAFGDSESEIKRVKGVVEDLKTSLQNFDDNNNFIVRLAEAAGKSKREILDLRLEQARLAQEAAQAAKDKAEANLDKARKDEWYWNGRSDELIAAEEAYNEAKEIEEARYRAVKEVLDDMAVYEEEQRTKKKEDDKKAAQDSAKQYANTLKENKKAAEKIIEDTRVALLEGKERELYILKTKYEEELALLKKTGNDTAQLTELYDKQRLAIIKKYADEEAKIRSEQAKKKYSDFQNDYSSADKNREKDINYNYNNAILDNPDMGEVERINLEIEKVNELDEVWTQHYNNRIALIDELINSGTLSDEEVVEQFKFRDELEREQLDKKREYNLQHKQLENDLTAYNKEQAVIRTTNIINTFAVTLNSVSQLLSAIQSNMDENDKEQFEKSKNLQIAMATINMLAGITAAVSGLFTTKTGPWDIALAAIQASTIAATGGIQIANIKKQKYDGSGGGNVGNLNGAGASPNVSMESLIPINYTRSVMTDTETTEMNKANRVYVLESDISDTQNNVAVKESNSSF